MNNLISGKVSGVLEEYLWTILPISIFLNRQHWLGPDPWWGGTLSRGGVIFRVFLTSWFVIWSCTATLIHSRVIVMLFKGAEDGSILVCAMPEVSSLMSFIDHFLACQWGGEYHHIPLSDFSQQVYLGLQSCYSTLSPGLQQQLPRMVEYDWLTSYRDTHVVRRV